MHMSVLLELPHKHTRATRHRSRNLTSHPAEGPEFSLSESPLKRQSCQSGWHNRADSRLWAAALYSPHRDQQFSISFLPHAGAHTLHPDTLQQQSLRSFDWRRWLTIGPSDGSSNPGRCCWWVVCLFFVLRSRRPRVLTNPPPDGVTKLSPTAPLLAGVVRVVVGNERRTMNNINYEARQACVRVFWLICFNPAVQ